MKIKFCIEKSSPNRRGFICGFTLAEVLITLGIIGVIAALVIPSVLLKKYNSETVATVKKTDSILSEALKLAQIEERPIEGWDKTGDVKARSTRFVEYLRPYIKIAKDCGLEASNECFSTDKYKFLHGFETTDWGNSQSYYKILLLDGVAFFADMPPAVPGSIWIDTNGPKKPNQYGKDFFAFTITDQGALIPQSPENKGLDCDITKDTSYNGQACTMHIITEGNMDYLDK